MARSPGGVVGCAAGRGFALSTFTFEVAESLDGPAWLSTARAGAFTRFAGMDLPTAADEVWRYSRIDDIDLGRWSPAGAGAAPAADSSAAGSLPAPIVSMVAGLAARAALVVTVNGRVAGVDRGERTPAGVEIVGLGGDTAVDDVEHLLGSVSKEPDAFVAMNAAFTPDPVLVRVPKGAAVEEPIVIVHVVDGDGVAVFPRTIVDVGEAAEATMIEIVTSGDVDALVVPVTELRVGSAANLRHVTVQHLGTRVWQIAYQVSEVADQATLLAPTVAIGGDYARMRTDSRLMGAGATGNLVAVYFGSGNQMHDFRTLQDHRAPKSNSDLLFKGAVAGTSHSVYSGLIRVRPGAKGTNAFQTNRNLVLSEGAHADSVPNLEIEENDVSCSHASAVGPVDEEQRYYLETRGVPTEVASRLIVLGFLRDVLDRVPVEALRNHLVELLADKLDRSDTDLLGGAA
jgi:Fe-S cluster assembly protein SufD